MTNEEAINEVKSYIPKDNGMNNKDILAFNIAISALEENTKLKAEIDELKSELETYYKLYLASIDARQILTECVEQLKAELEQSVN